MVLGESMTGWKDISKVDTGKQPYIAHRLSHVDTSKPTALGDTSDAWREILLRTESEFMSSIPAASPRRRRIDRWIYAIPVLLLLTVIFYLILFNGPGMLRLMVYYLGSLVVSFLALVFLLIGVVRSLIKRPFFSGWRMAGFAGLLLFPLSYFLLLDKSGYFFTAYPSSHAGYQSDVSFRLPLDGPIGVAWGGDKASTNYHVINPDQRWAYDLWVRRGDKTFAGDSTQLSSYFCYGLPVLAPAAGRVVGIVDTMRDEAIGQSDIILPHGNHIVLSVAPHEFLFLCHLKPGSLRVRKGDSVQQGQPLAQVGNSGNTSEPHLHVHLQDTDEPGFGEGIPLYFSHYRTGEKVVEKGMPRGGFTDDWKAAGEVVENMSSFVESVKDGLQNF